MTAPPNGAAERIAGALSWLRSTVVVAELELEYQPLSTEAQETFDRWADRFVRMGLPFDDEPWRASGLLDYGRQRAMFRRVDGLVVFTRGREHVVGFEGGRVSDAHSWGGHIPNPLWAVGLLRDVTIWEDAGRHARVRSTRRNAATHPNVGRLRRRFDPPPPATIDCEFDDGGRLVHIRATEPEGRSLHLRFKGDAPAEAVRAWDLETLAVPNLAPPPD